MDIISTPNLPKSTVSLVAIGERYFDVLKKPLNDLGSEIFLLNDSKILPKAVCSHADMLICHLGHEIILSKEVFFDGKSKDQLHSLGFKVFEASKKTKKDYPGDINLNVLYTGNVLCHNLNYTDPKITEILKERDIKNVNVKQGYTKCSVAVISHNALITDDARIYAALNEHFDVLLIEKGDITLENYNYGFIGGCCGLIDRDKIAFTGRYDKLKNKKQIDLFLEKHNVTPVFLTSCDIFDIGSMIPLMQY